MNLEKNWIKKRWLEERFGHSSYLMYVLTLVNFILISYRYFIESDPILHELISDLWLFTIILLIFYVPISILIGYWHRQTQLSTENTIKRLEDPLFAHISRTILDLKTGTISENQIKEIKKLLLKIENESK